LDSGEDGEVLLRDTGEEGRTAADYMSIAHGGSRRSEGWGARRVAGAVEKITKPVWLRENVSA
jgi:hypothetical protein